MEAPENNEVLVEEKPDEVDYVYPDGVRIQPVPWLKRPQSERASIWRHYLSRVDNQYDLREEGKLKHIENLGAPFNFRNPVTEEGIALANGTFDDFEKQLSEFLEKFNDAEYVYYVENSNRFFHTRPQPDEHDDYEDLESMLFLQGVDAAQIKKIKEKVYRYGQIQKPAGVQMIANALGKDIVTLTQKGGGRWEKTSFEDVLPRMIPRDDWDPPPVLRVTRELVPNEEIPGTYTFGAAKIEPEVVE